MKINLNGYILENEKFLLNLFENNQIKCTDYEKYILSNDNKLHNLYPQLFELCDEFDVNIYPYLYTLEQITSREKDNFTKFILTNMKKHNLINNINYKDDLLNVISNSIDYIFILIITIQYYFL